MIGVPFQAFQEQLQERLKGLMRSSSESISVSYIRNMKSSNKLPGVPGLHRYWWWHIWEFTVIVMPLKCLFSFLSHSLFFANTFQLRPRIAVQNFFLYMYFTFPCSFAMCSGTLCTQCSDLILFLNRSKYLYHYYLLCYTKRRNKEFIWKRLIPNHIFKQGFS